MKYRTDIDLNKMSSLGRIIYLQSLIRDASNTLQEISTALPLNHETESLIDHLEQAVIDLRKVQP